MKDFFSLCNDIVTSRSYNGNQQQKKEQFDSEGFLDGFSNNFFHPKRYGESRSKPKSAFLLLMIGVVGIAAGCLVIFVNPYDLLFKLKIILSDGGEIYEIFKEPPVELYLRVHLWNITNREAFLAGQEKLKVVEVGPYVYREYMAHTNVTFNANGTMTSVPHHPLEYMPQMSNGTEEDILILPNIALLSFAQVMMGKSYFSQMAVNLLVRQTDTHPLVAMTAREFMFGYKSALVTLGNKVLPSWISFDKLGLIDRMYDFDGDVSTIYTGETDIGKTGLLATYNRSPKLPQWDMPCGAVKDSSDGTKFPSFIKPNDSLKFFRKSLCRSMNLVREGNETTRSGLRAFRYTFEENALDNGEFRDENKCFCRHGNCFPRGLVDVTDCYYGFPIALSYPHLYKTDESVQAMTEGSKPDPQLHSSFFLIQPESGLPLEVAVRMQINMALGDVSRTTRCAPFKNMVLPLLWTEIRMYQLPPKLSTLFSIYINTLPLVQDAAIYLLFTGGIAFVLAAIIKLIRKVPDDVSPIPSIPQPEKVQQAKSPAFNSKDVFSEIIDEGRQVLFGKKPVKPKSNVYRETVRQKSSMSLFGFLKNDSQLCKQVTKEDLYEVKRSKESASDAKPLKLSSSDSESDDKGDNKTYSDGDDSPHLNETEEQLQKILESPVERRKFETEVVDETT